jgi:glycosyltransferase involved in cell wall biosynthesis
VLRTEIAKHYAKCKVGIVTVNSETDSCPRVIPEMLACGLPIIVLDGVRFWRDKYIESATSSRSQSSTGEVVNKENFWSFVLFVLNNLNLYNPRQYYKYNLSLPVAAKFLRGKIDEVRV